MISNSKINLNEVNLNSKKYIVIDNTKYPDDGAYYYTDLSLKTLLTNQINPKSNYYYTYIYCFNFYFLFLIKILK